LPGQCLDGSGCVSMDPVCQICQHREGTEDWRVVSSSLRAVYLSRSVRYCSKRVSISSVDIVVAIERGSRMWTLCFVELQTRLPFV
jgi:hypothetical protein